ncbi:MAG: hypothetical protein ACXWLR_11085 [Myxococcales bacterium]
MRVQSRAASVLSIALLASSAARADHQCTEIDSPIVTRYFVDGCTSPLGICTEGTVRIGKQQATTRFRALTVAPGPSPDVLLYTGELVITTREGTLTIRDSGLLQSATGQFFELDEVVSGTNKYKHLRGLLTSQGLATPTGFDGTLTGMICRVDAERPRR